MLIRGVNKTKKHLLGFAQSKLHPGDSFVLTLCQYEPVNIFKFISSRVVSYDILLTYRFKGGDAGLDEV